MKEKIDIIVKGYWCNRCGHKWIPRKKNPRICPKCKSAYWDIPKINKTKKKIRGID